MLDKALHFGRLVTPASLLGAVQAARGETILGAGFFFLAV